MDRNEAGPPGPEAPLPEGEEEAPRGVRAAAIVRWGIVLAVAAVAAVAVGRAVVSGDTEQAGAAIYYCPMHPEIVQDHPGECPICGMDLVPRPKDAPSPEADGGGGTAVPGLVPVTLSNDRLQASGIRIGRATKKTLSAEVRALGTIGADERRMAEVTARVSGWLTAGRAAAVGDALRRGQSLGAIDSPEVLAAARELIEVRQLGRAQTVTGVDLTAPVRQKLEILGVPRAQIDQILRTGQPSGLVPISAPIAGHVIARGPLPGGYVDRGTTLYQIADLGTVWALIDVYPSDLGRIEVGQAARVTLEGGAAPPADGRVTYIYPTTDAATRTTKVRVELPNPELRLRPGLFADVRLETSAVVGIAVPIEAVADSGDLQYVFLSRGGGRFEPRPVRLGVRSDGEVIVTEGLSEGDEIVTSAAFLLDSESRLRSAVQAHGEKAADPHAAHRESGDAP